MRYVIFTRDGAYSAPTRALADAIVNLYPQGAAFVVTLA